MYKPGTGDALTPGLMLRAGLYQDRLRVSLQAGELVPEAGLVAALEAALRRQLAAWGQLHQNLAGGYVENRQLDVTLIVAARSQHEFGVLWRRMSNGFDPHWFGALSVHQVDLQHDAITHDSVGDAAAILAAEFAQAR